MSRPAAESRPHHLGGGSLQKKFLMDRKKAGFSVRRERVDFIGWKAVFFTKIHETGKSCQSYHRFQIPI